MRGVVVLGGHPGGVRAPQNRLLPGHETAEVLGGQPEEFEKGLHRKDVGDLGDEAARARSRIASIRAMTCARSRASSGRMLRAEERLEDAPIARLFGRIEGERHRRHRTVEGVERALRRSGRRSCWSAPIPSAPPTDPPPPTGRPGPGSPSASPSTSRFARRSSPCRASMDAGHRHRPRTPRRRLGRRTDRPTHPRQVAARVAGSRAPRTLAPRSAAAVHRRRRAPVRRLHHRHPRGGPRRHHSDLEARTVPTPAPSADGREVGRCRRASPR